MFAESLLESSATSHRTNRGWTTAASLVLQIFIIGILAVVPVLYPQALSLVQHPPQIPIFSSAPQRVPNTPAQRAAVTPSAVTFIPSNNAIHYGPAKAQPEIGDPLPPGIALLNNLQNLTLITDFHPPQPTAPKPTKLVISHPDPASLIHDVKPVYPQAAIIMRLQGTVVLHALISKEGTIESLQVVSGHPFLARAAQDAVRQWRYRPYILNGQPVEIETQITVNFKLANE